MIFLTFSLLTIVSTVAILVPLCVCVSFWVEEGGLELLPTTLLVTRKFHLDVNWLLWISVPVTYSFLTTLVALETGRRSLNAA
jgi:hypothetical protein